MTKDIYTGIATIRDMQRTAKPNTLVYFCGAPSKRYNAKFYKIKNKKIDCAQESIPEKYKEFWCKDEYFHLLNEFHEDLNIKRVLLVWPNTKEAEEIKNILIEFTQEFFKDITIEEIQIDINGTKNLLEHISQLVGLISNDSYNYIFDITHAYRLYQIFTLLTLVETIGNERMYHILVNSVIIYSKPDNGGFELVVNNMSSFINGIELISAISLLDYKRMDTVSKNEKENKDLINAIKKFIIAIHLGLFQEAKERLNEAEKAEEIIRKKYNIPRIEGSSFYDAVNVIRSTDTEDTISVIRSGLEIIEILKRAGQEQSSILLLVGVLDKTLDFAASLFDPSKEVKDLVKSDRSRDLGNKLREVLLNKCSNMCNKDFMNEYIELLKQINRVYSQTNQVRHGIAHPMVGKSVNQAFGSLAKGRINKMIEDNIRILGSIMDKLDEWRHKIEDQATT